MQKYRLVPLVHAKKPTGPSSRVVRMPCRRPFRVFSISRGSGLVIGRGCVPRSSDDQPLPQRRAMGPFFFCHCRHQLDHCRHRCQPGTMGSRGCLAGLGCHPSFLILDLVDCTRTQIHHQRAVKPDNSLKSAPKPPHFLMLINNLHGFIH